MGALPPATRSGRPQWMPTHARAVIMVSSFRFQAGGDACVPGQRSRTATRTMILVSSFKFQAPMGRGVPGHCPAPSPLPSRQVGINEAGRGSLPAYTGQQGAAWRPHLHLQPQRGAGARRAAPRTRILVSNFSAGGNACVPGQRTRTAQPDCDVAENLQIITRKFGYVEKKM